MKASQAGLLEALARLERDEHAESVQTLETLLPLLDSDADRATALLALTRSLPRLGRLPEAVRAGSEALSLFERLGDNGGACDSNTALALAYAQLEIGREAIECALQALDEARQLNDRPREAWALLRVGNAYMALGDPVQARETTQQAREIAQACGLSVLEFACLSNQAYYTLDECELLLREGETERVPFIQALAQTLAQDAVLQAQSEGNAFRQALALSNLIDALLLGGDWARAEPLLFAAIELAERCGYTALRLEARLQHARLAAGQGRPEESMQLAERLLHDNDAAKGPRLERRTLQHLYVTCKQQGKVDAALHFLERLLEAERRSMRRAQAVQTQVLLIRQEVQHAMARAAHAHAHAQAAQERAQGLEQEQLRLRERLARTEHAAMEDLLTRLANRRHAEHALPLLMARTELEPLALALLDIDHFKRVNDQFGHAVGDRVLRDFGALLRQQLRGADLLARWGGEEFVVVLTGEGARRAAQIMDRLKRAVENHPWHRLSEGLALTTSVGLTLQHPSETPPPWAQVVLRADQALYRAKASGRNQVCSA